MPTARLELEVRFVATVREAVENSREIDESATDDDGLADLEAEYDGLDGGLLADGEVRPRLNVLANGPNGGHPDGSRSAISKTRWRAADRWHRRGRGLDRAAVLDGGRDRTVDNAERGTDVLVGDAETLDELVSAFAREAMQAGGYGSALPSQNASISVRTPNAASNTPKAEIAIPDPIGCR